MGIQGLLPLLKSIHDNVHIAAYANQRVAVDTYVWLHRGTYTCATELCLGQPTEKYLDYCLGLVDLLVHYKVSPVMVFDGACLPQKRGTEIKRRSSRQSNKAKGRVCYEEGNLSAAMKFFQKAVDITPAMAHKLIHHLRLRGVEYIVAPYEADAQLAFLSISNYVAAVISEDSDLLVFGCKRVLYKMDKQGHGVEIRLANIAANEPYNFANWTQTMLQLMAVLSGCDYLPSLDGMGIKKAYQEVQQNKTLERVLARLRADARFAMPPGYEEQFKMAIMTFNYQRVFDPVSCRLVSLHPLPPDLQLDSSFLGPVVSDEVANQIAQGLIHPDTHRPFDLEPETPLNLRRPAHHRCDSPKSSPRRLVSRSPPSHRLSPPSHRLSPPSSFRRLSPSPPRSSSLSRDHHVSDFFDAVAEYKSNGSNANTLFPGLEPLPGLGRSAAAQRPFIRPAAACQVSLNSSERWTDLFHKSRSSGRQANKENERVHINLLEDEDEPDCATASRTNTIELMDEKAGPRSRAPRVGLAKSSLISSRSRLTVPRTYGLLGTNSASSMWPGSLATFPFSSSSTTSISSSRCDVIDLEEPLCSSTSKQREIFDITALSPSPKRPQFEPSLSPENHKQKLTRVKPLQDQQNDSFHRHAPAQTSSQASLPASSFSFSFPPITPSFVPSDSDPFFFDSTSSTTSYSKPFDYTVVDDCPSPCSEVDEDALTPDSTPRSPHTTRKSRSVLSPPTSPVHVCVVESPPVRRRFSFEDR